MKISLFFKSYTNKAYSFIIMSLFIASIPAQAHASFLTDLFSGPAAQADNTIEAPIDNSLNSQNMPLLETSINPDSNNASEPDSTVIVQNDSFIYSDGIAPPDVKYETSPLSDQIKVYTVEKGDTVSSIADTFGVSTNTIRWENNLTGQTIPVGQKLNILPLTGVKHVVKSGDTVAKIADKYEADAEDILIFNGLLKGDALKQGDILFIPNGIIKPVVVKAVVKPSSHATYSNTKAQSGYYIRPVAGIVTSPYGSRRGGFHPGVDIGNVRGTPVVAAADGVVSEVVNGCTEGYMHCGGGYGNHIVIDHANGTKTRYAHLSKTNVSVGQSVSQGQRIGALGNTGSSTGPHLHFEVENSNGSKMRPPV